MLLAAGVASVVSAIDETCAGWPLDGKTTSFAGSNRWQHVGNHRVEVIVNDLPRAATRVDK